MKDPTKPNWKTVTGTAITADIDAYVTNHPGRSATEIARAIKRTPAAVSGILNRLIKRGQIHRVPGGGPQGGYIYFKKAA
jgi:predicted transcriptional regulator